MSGIINEHENSEKSRNHRYETMLRKINKANALPLAQESLYESRMQSLAFKSNNDTFNTQSLHTRGSNPTNSNFHTEEQIKLPSVSQKSGSIVSERTNDSNFGSSIRYKKNISHCVQQPYLQGLNPNRNEFSAMERSNAPSTTTSVSNYAPSETTLFKQPFPPRHLNEKARLKGRIDIMLQLCREDKPYLRFVSRLIESTMQVYSQQISLPMNYTSVLEMIGQTFIENYGSEILKGVGFSAPSSLRSESMISLNTGPHETFGVMHPPGKPTENCREEMAMYNRNISTSSSSLTNTNVSQIAQRRDESAIRSIPLKKIQSKATSAKLPEKPTQSTETYIKALPKPTLNASVNRRGRMRKEDTSLLLSISEETLQGNITQGPLLDSRVKGVTRNGRAIRSPRPYWKGNDTTQQMNFIKEKEESIRQTPLIDVCKAKKVDLNESMTLRNKKIIEKKKTPPIKTKTLKNAPLAEVNKSNETLKTKENPKQNNKAVAKKEDKENLSQKTKPKNKQSKKDQIKEDSTLKKLTTTSKKEKNAPKEPTEKKVRKRKVEEKQETVLESSICKKKRVHEIEHHSSEDEEDLDDDLFGIVNYNKSTKPAYNVVSPNSGMMSIKKAAAAASFCKETPPCRMFGQFNQSGVSATSTSKEVLATKPDQVVKRVGKVLKRKVKKPATKQTGKNQATTNKVIPHTTPLNTAQLIYAVLGKSSETNSDESDFENDDDIDLQ